MRCSNVLNVMWRYVWTKIVLWVTTQRTTYKTSFCPSSIQKVEALTTVSVKEHGYLQFFFRNLSCPLCSKDITAILRHTEQCMFPSQHSAFCFTNLSCFILKIFRFFEKHAQNSNTLQNNSTSWDIQMGLNLAFKRLKCICWFYYMTYL